MSKLKTIAVATHVTGIATINGKKLKPGTLIKEGDIIETGPKPTLVAIIFIDDKSMVKIIHDTSWEVPPEHLQNVLTKSIALDRGFNIFGGGGPSSGNKFLIATPTGVASTKG